MPGAALATHAAHHATGSHHKHHKRHAHAVRFIAGSVKKTTTATKSTPTTTTTTTTTETPGETIGTVTSFEGGVLKITLGDGTAVSGKVTERTELRCATEGTTEGSDGGDEGTESGEGDDHHGETPPVGTPPSHDSGSGGSWEGHDGGSGVSGSHGDDEHGMAGEEPVCAVAALVPGAKVEEAELVLSSAGAVWEKVQLTK
jgi:hypothetical protein